VAVVIAYAVDRAFSHRKGRMGEAMADLSPEAHTRLRLVRRLVFVAIILVGLSLALSQFEGIRRLTTGVLASSAVLGIVVGFAARQTLANAVAGFLLAIARPIRIGDLVTFEDETGTVEDIGLTYTYIRAGDGRRVIVPNERLASSTIDNFTIVDPRVHVEVDFWISPSADAARAVQLLREVPGVEEVEVAEIDKEGIRLKAGTWTDDAMQRAPKAARIRAEGLERLQEERLFSGAERP